jgi:hypothetical protein
MAEQPRLAPTAGGFRIFQGGLKIPRLCREWSTDPAWKRDFSNIALLSPEEITRRRAEFDRQKEIAKTIRSKPEAAE